MVELFPASLIRLFSRDSAELLAIGVTALRLCLAALPIVGFQIVAASYFQAVGKPRQAMLLMLSRQVLLLIPAILILPRFFGLRGIYYAVPLADLGSALLTGIWLARELRRLCWWMVCRSPISPGGGSAGRRSLPTSFSARRWGGSCGACNRGILT